MAEAEQVLILACGALAREVRQAIAPARLAHVTLRCLPAKLHNRPARIPEAVAAALDQARGFDRIFVAYADCGTGGELDRVLSARGIERLPGAHCYQFFAGTEAFAAAAEADLRSFFLTDFLARQFRRIVFEPLGLARHPDLRDAYFGQYERVVHLAQTDDPKIRDAADRAADSIGLPCEHRLVGLGDLGRDIGAL